MNIFNCFFFEMKCFELMKFFQFDQSVGRKFCKGRRRRRQRRLGSRRIRIRIVGRRRSWCCHGDVLGVGASLGRPVGHALAASPSSHPAPPSSPSPPPTAAAATTTTTTQQHGRRSSQFLATSQQPGNI